MVKLKTTQSFRFGQKNIIPFAGEVEISENGVIEVEESIAEKVVLSNCGFNFFEEEILKKVEENDFDENEGNDDLHKDEEENDLSKDNEDNKVDEESDEESEEFDEESLRKELEEKTVAELKEIAYDSGFEEEEYKDKKKKAELIDYLVEKFRM